MDVEWQDALMRLGAATASGMAIGLNRDLTHKPIGMRTLALVSLGAAAVSVSAIQFSFMDNHPDALSRVVQGVIQGIMAGISFIGAGVILRDHKAGEVTGLTTAATVWVAAALGIACGLGAWVIVGATLGLALFVLAGLAGVDAWLSREKAERNDRTGDAPARVGDSSSPNDFDGRTTRSP
jgi:putative Mg2+ transporter-C (MgtC) family protein